MSRFMPGESVEITAGFSDNSIDVILNDPSHLGGFKDRSGLLSTGLLTGYASRLWTKED